MLELNGVLGALLSPDQAIMREMMAALADSSLFGRRRFHPAGYDVALDNRGPCARIRQVVAQLQARYADDTGVKT